MDRKTLEKAWFDCYDFNSTQRNISCTEKAQLIAKTPDVELASDVYNASMEMRAEGINWFDSEFEDELVAIIGSEKTKNADIHISAKEIYDIKSAQEKFLKEG